LCKTSLATLENPEIKEAVRVLKNHLPTHMLAEIYDFAVRNASQFFPEIVWDYASREA
jgi:hypothetical protein